MFYKSVVHVNLQTLVIYIIRGKLHLPRFPAAYSTVSLRAGCVNVQIHPQPLHLI